MLRLWSRVGIALSLFAALQIATPVDAAWSGYTAIGSGPVASDVSCAADGVGTAVCAALSTGSTMMVTRYNGTSWSGWSDLSYVLTAAPSCASGATAEVVCASRNYKFEMSAYLWNGKTWSAPLNVAAGIVSAPNCAGLSGGKVICAARAATDGISAAVYSGGTWATSSWTRPAVVADSVYGPVNCTTDDVGHAICAYLGVGSTTEVREFGTAWSGAINVGGEATATASCTDAGVAGKVGCFATGTDSSLNAQAFAGGAFTASKWGGYSSFGGLVHTYSCAQYGQKAGLINYACTAVGLTNSGFYTNEYNGNSWSGWTQIGTATFIGSPSCFALNRTVTPGRVMCALTTVGNVAVAITGP